MAYRTFLALDLDASILDALGQARSWFGPAGSIRWTAGQNIHLTMQFLGDVPEELMQILHLQIMKFPCLMV